MAMMKSTPTRRELEAEIRRRARRLPLPTDYWKGWPERAPECPWNILVFFRARAAHLLRHAPNQHHRFLLIANFGGSGKVGVDARIHPLREHQAIVVFPFQSHFYADFSSSKLDWVFVSFECARDSALESLRSRGALGLGQEALGHFRDLLRAWNARQQTLPLHLALLLHDLAHAAHHRDAAPSHAAAKQSDSLVERVNRLVFENRHRALSLRQIAGMLGVSTSLLRQRFGAATGRSIGRHAREVRLGHACQLLCDTAMGIEEISERCGYQSLFAFSRAFRSEFGRSPSRYRKDSQAGR